MITAIDALAALVQALKQAQDEADKWTEAATVLKKRIQEAMGEATEATVAGRTVFTWRRTGQFAARRFATEQPELTARYTRQITRDELDVKALEREHPELFTAYRARRFEVKG